MRERNKSVDIIRGFAMLMVVLGHTISGSSINFEQSFVFQIIWTLQIPLFILISGYVTRYSRPITNFSELVKFIKKRTLAYMLPWLVWTVLIRGIIFEEPQYTDLKFIIWNMDSGYWFLGTIWTISIFFGLTEYFINKIALVRENPVRQIAMQITGCFISMIVIGFIGYIVGLNFFAIKLTLYYFPFYIIGYLYGRIQENLTKSYINKYSHIFNAICFLSWIYLINRIDFYSGEVEISIIILRFFTSLIGCISVISLISVSPREILVEGAKDQKNNLSKFFNWIGINSIAIYLLHNLFLCILKYTPKLSIDNVHAILLIFLNYTITVICCIVSIRIIHRNQFLNKLLFWK